MWGNPAPGPIELSPRATDTRRVPVRVWGWIAASLAALGGVGLALGKPGTLAFWLSPLLVVPLLTCLGAALLSPWSGVSAARRVLAWVTVGVMVAAAASVAILWQSERGYLVAGMLLLPALVVLAVREADDDRRRTRWDDPTLDVPDFPGD
jgi:hypothetical protein